MGLLVGLVQVNITLSVLTLQQEKVIVELLIAESNCFTRAHPSRPTVSTTTVRTALPASSLNVIPSGITFQTAASWCFAVLRQVG